MTQTASFFKTGNIFNILVFLVTIVGLIYLLLWSFQPENNSLIAQSLAVIFLIFILVGVIFSGFEFFRIGTWTQSCVSFVLGFFIWATIASSLGQTQSVISLPPNVQFATLQSQLPRSLDFVMTAIVIPIAEEMLWIVGIPFFVIWINSLIGKKYELFKSKTLQLMFIILISGTTFAYFHVGKQFLLFLIAAFMFRTIMVLVVWGEPDSAFGRWYTAVFSFSMGAHIANNWATYGWLNGISILNDNLFPVGLLVYLFLGAIIFTVGYAVYRIASGKRSFSKGLVSP